MRLLCRVNLELEGYRVLEAPVLQVARDLLAGEEVDLLVLDVHVAGEEGWDLLDDVRRETTPVMLMTGTAEVNAEQRALVDAVVPKPFRLDEFLSTVGRLTDAKSDR